MGQSFSFQALNSLRSFIWNTKEAKIIMVGLDAAGKTTILFNLKLNEGEMRNLLLLDESNEPNS